MRSFPDVSVTLSPTSGRSGGVVEPKPMTSSLTLPDKDTYSSVSKGEKVRRVGSELCDEDLHDWY
jgi:hypothetical protein